MFTVDAGQQPLLNSATKYPSISTYHALSPTPKIDGLLSDHVTVFDGPALLSEKIDGTNGRIIFTGGGDYFIGSREELLYARGDRVENPNLGIVPALKPVADRIADTMTATGADHLPHILVVYGEVYGKSIATNGHQYQGDGGRAFRAFDIAQVPGHVLTWSREKVASWRDHGGQQWLVHDDLKNQADALGIPLVPSLGTVQAAELPATLEDTAAWLEKLLPATLAALDSNAKGRPEGVILRSADRSVIAKARFEDYRKTLLRRTEPKR